jgi:hypothetical protein
MEPQDRKSQEKVEVPAGRRIWEPIILQYVGDVKDVVLGGGGKLSITGGDPGEGRKPPGQG